VWAGVGLTGADPLKDRTTNVVVAYIIMQKVKFRAY